MRSFEALFVISLNKLLNKQFSSRWFGTPWCSCRCNVWKALWSCDITWWCNQMETFSALLALCAGNSPVTGEFPAQRSATRSSDVSLDLCMNKRLSKQSWGWWSETPSCSLWRQCNGSPKASLSGWHIHIFGLHRYFITTRHNKAWTMCVWSLGWSFFHRKIWIRSLSAVILAQNLH